VDSPAVLSLPGGVPNSTASYQRSAKRTGLAEAAESSLVISSQRSARLQACGNLFRQRSARRTDLRNPLVVGIGRPAGSLGRAWLVSMIFAMFRDLLPIVGKALGSEGYEAGKMVD